jgi:hypothetical protein
MTAHLPPDDRPPQEWRRIDDEGEANLPPEDLRNPASVAFMFFNAIEDPGHFRDALHFLTTPESHTAWGDYREVAEAITAIEEPGLGTMPTPAADDDAVVYAKVMSGVVHSYKVLDEQPVLAAGVITLVWRPDFGRRMVHAFGQPLLPEDVPHG